MSSAVKLLQLVTGRSSHRGECSWVSGWFPSLGQVLFLGVWTGDWKGEGARERDSDRNRHKGRGRRGEREREID